MFGAANTESRDDVQHTRLAHLTESLPGVSRIRKGTILREPNRRWIDLCSRPLREKERTWRAAFHYNGRPRSTLTLVGRFR